jgi:hypothetical protein
MNLAIPKKDGSGDFYLFSNADLAVGDQVFPLVHGYKNHGKFYLLGTVIEPDMNPEFILAVTGWPSKPHTIKHFFAQEGLLHAKTDKGSGPSEIYFKLVSPQEENRQ